MNKKKIEEIKINKNLQLVDKTQKARQSKIYQKLTFYYLIEKGSKEGLSEV